MGAKIAVPDLKYKCAVCQAKYDKSDKLVRLHCMDMCCKHLQSKDFDITTCPRCEEKIHPKDLVDIYFEMKYEPFDDNKVERVKI